MRYRNFNFRIETEGFFTRATLCYRGIRYDLVSVRLSARHKPVLYRNGRTDGDDFGTEAALSLSYIVLEAKSAISKNNVRQAYFRSKLWTLKYFSTARPPWQVLSTWLDR